MELCLTSQLFRNIDFELTEHESDEAIEIPHPKEAMEKTAAETRIEEEALRYIGSYIVRKFSLKHP